MVSTPLASIKWFDLIYFFFFCLWFQNGVYVHILCTAQRERSKSVQCKKKEEDKLFFGYCNKHWVGTGCRTCSLIRCKNALMRESKRKEACARRNSLRTVWFFFSFCFLSCGFLLHIPGPKIYVYIYTFKFKKAHRVKAYQTDKFKLYKEWANENK